VYLDMNDVRPASLSGARNGLDRGFIARWTRMLHCTGRLSASASSHHDLFWAAFITD
jgi:hypothetical protein